MRDSIAERNVTELNSEELYQLIYEAVNSGVTIGIIKAMSLILLLASIATLIANLVLQYLGG